MSIVPCKETDCHRKVQARGMCTTHYSYWQRATKGRTDKVHTKACAFCSGTFTTTTKRVLFCSLVCAQRDRHHKTTDLVKRLRPKVWLGSALSPRNGAAMVAGQCAYCPTYFIGLPGARYCSERCNTNASWKRRYDRRGEFKVTDRIRLAIYERDAYTCQICSEPVDTTLHYHDRMSATLDHIIPQSWMLIPDHSEANLRLAHRGCNSARGDRASAA
jgi:5-methylcytosine-specific restriction endonuclease McrA